MVLFFNNCTAPPKQPELSVKERVFFNELNKKCGCNCIREIDSNLSKKVGEKEKGNYFLGFEDLSCKKLKKDSLEKYSNILVKIFYINILEKNPKYESITIDFACKTGKNEDRSVSFNYNFSGQE